MEMSGNESEGKKKLTQVGLNRRGTEYSPKSFLCSELRFKMDEYQYPLFFEAKDLTDTEMKKVRIYFQIRRLSGGGDCSTLQAVRGDVYKICFKDKEDQKRVWQKKLHMVSFERYLIMSQTDLSQKPDQPLMPTFKKPNPQKRPIGRYEPAPLSHSDMKRNLSLKTLKLQGAAAVPPDLDRVKEMLINANNVANFGVIISFIPVGTKMMEVRLVGYRENVNQLVKVLCDYQTNQAHTQERLNLPFPELVDCLDEVLHLIGLKHTEVKLKTSTTPNPCVLLSGPCCHVEEVKQALIPALASLTSDTLVLDGPGAQQYFQAEGKVCKDLIQSSCQVLIREHPGVNSDERSCLTPVENIAANQANLQIKFGKLENQQVNVLVVPMLHKKLTSTKVGNNLLTKAGNTMQSNFDAAAAKCTINPGDVLQVAGPPSLGCNKLFFIECLPWDGVRGRSVQALRNGLRRCLDLCVQQELSSVAFPVIGPGKALGYPLCVAIEALTQSIYQFGSWGVIGSLSNIYVVIKPCFPDSECYHAVYRSLQGGQVSLPHKKWNPQRSVTATPIIFSTSFYTQQSVFLFMGLCGWKVSDAKMKLKQLYQDRCLTHIFTAKEVGSLSQDDIVCLQQLVYKEGLKILSVQGNMTVSGLKDGVNKVMQMIKESQLSNLRRQVIVTEEENLHSRVAWCILGSSGNWERLPKTANHRLEHNNLAGGIMDEQGNQWTVDLKRMEATGQVTREIRKIKRLENRPDFTLPLYWDNMAAGEDMKVVTLQESSPEYRSVEQAFRRTVPEGRIKIERLQNVHLRRAYEAQKKHISDKNAHEGTEVEKVLYHGTTQDNCDAIMKTGFNRRFAGQNATQFGEGTYFAVNASYSAQHIYARPTVEGSQRIFVAQVLTGIYTVGRRNMKVPPPRNDFLPHDRFDSVVNRMDNPSIHVVFHDNQAYPDYLITILGTQEECRAC
ncbi:protein mono-ADP-ribosyltransferase PARP14 [Pleuronectes platessa]|uniref:protein mono-ADP-ribosyltransferase PARP14 n=1 Tax=Pleuronectes platessa TaxID=8262 RepID=UPI00232A4E32|nr:protein mono-ADP-ribosyltransferase PARP14 [Pleuronectes platessa]